MSFSWQNLDYPLILCPPMDGITDYSYRELVSEMGGADVVYCEFINVKGLIYQNPKTIFELRYSQKQRPVIAQLFGSDPDDFYEAAKLVVNMGFDAIDINMGCPAHKVAAKGSGCALMGDLPRAKKIVEMTVKGANEAFEGLKKKNLDLTGEYEVTCKMRLGIDSKDIVFTHAPAMIEAGAKAVAIHGRTLKQMYTGEADWEPVRKIRQIIEDSYRNSPNRPKVFGSGDVKDLRQAFIRFMTTGVDGVMIGRGSFGNPWVFDQKIVDALKHKVKEQDFFKYATENLNVPLHDLELKIQDDFHEIISIFDPIPKTFDEIAEMAIHHAELMEKDKTEAGIVQMRKHLAWYFHDFDGAKELRSRLVRVNTVDEIRTILEEFKEVGSVQLAVDS